MNTAILTVGTDPEFFAVNKDGKFIALCGKLGGDKEHPRPVVGGAILEDNVLLELNVQPATSAKEFSSNIVKVMTQARRELYKQGLRLSITQSTEMEPDQLEDIRATIFGCVPDYNTWTGKENPRVSPPPSLRMAGGHIHVGFDWCNDFPAARDRAVRAMDLFVGLPLFVATGAEDVRRTYYGRFGNYRPTPYGIEYRSPSNWWLGSKRKMEYVFEQTNRAIMFASRVGDMTSTPAAFFRANGDVKDAILKARSIMSSYEIPTL